MKKVISLILCLSVLLGCRFQAFANEENSVSALIDLMHTLGIMEDYESEIFAVEQKVTRATFVKEAAALIREGEAKTDKVYYHDVSKDYWAFNSIGRLTELGIICGNEEQCFNPERIITKAEAAKIMLTILGYNEYGVTDESYPQGYLRLAEGAKLFTKCSGGNEITMLDMLHIFRNALEAEVISVNFEHGRLTYKKSDTTLLEQYYKMYFGDGTVTGCDGIDLSSGERIQDGKVYIDGVAYETELTGLIDCLGRRVEFIYNENNTGDYNLIWLNSTGKSDVLAIGIAYEKNFDANEYVLSYSREGSDKYKRLKIARNINVVYNGAYVKDGIENIFSKEKYSVTFVGNDGDYSLAIVEAYENYSVADADFDKCVIYDDNAATKKISLNEDDWETVEITKSGSKAVFSDIKIGDIVSVFESYDGESVKAIISSNTVEGSVSCIDVYETEIAVLINGGTYYFYDSAAANNVRAGDNVILHLDYNNYIADLTVSIGSETVAYVIRAVLSVDSETVNLKLLTRNGVGTYDCSSKLRIDGVRATDTIIANELTGGLSGQTVQRLVVVKFDSEQKIRDIYTAGKTADSDFKLYMSGAGGRYRSSLGKLGAKVLLDDDTLIFSVPAQYSTDSDDFSIKNRWNLSDDTDYTADIYRYRTEDLDFEEILVMRGIKWSTLSNWDECILVDKIYYALNDDDEAVECLEGYKGATAVTLKADVSYSFKNNGIKSGDLIRVTTNNNGSVDSASVAYSYGSSPQVGDDYNANFRVAAVHANDKVGNVLRVGYESGADFDEIFNLKDVTILVYDPDKGKERITKGTIADVRTYKTAGDSCSTVVIQTANMNTRLAVVYAK